MNKDEATMIGFEIVAYSGDARAKLLLALERAKAGNFEECSALIREANECLNDAHRSQTTLLQQEARGENVEIGFITVHAQDHLMTAMLLSDMDKRFIKMFKEK
jgi:PTS system lactose-specific IIA component